MELYRFRSIQSLLGAPCQGCDSCTTHALRSELDEQVLAFSNAMALNDPLEMSYNFEWRGDKIVWTNLFRFYAYSVSDLVVSVAISDKPLDFRTFCNALELYDGILAPSGKDAFDKVWERVSLLNGFSKFIDGLAALNRGINSRELLQYLRFIHLRILDIAVDELAPFWRKTGIPSGANKMDFTVLSQLLDAYARVDDPNDIPKFIGVYESVVSANLATYDEALSAGFFTSGRSNSVPMENTALLYWEFPEVFMQDILRRLIVGDSHVTSLSGDFANPLMWAHYADGHRGACLIFEVPEPNKFPLTNETLELRKVSYSDTRRPIDGFRSFGNTTYSMLERFIYKDSKGQWSNCASHITGGEAVQDTWRKNYWGALTNALTEKSKCWEYEDEWRVIQHQILNDRQEDVCFAHWDFQTLKGIILGSAISRLDRHRIIEVVKRKCETNGRDEFEFYQASIRTDGSISKSEIQIALT